MGFKPLAAVLLVIGGASAACLARDPGPIETRDRASGGFVPERVDTSKLHGPPPRPRQERPLYQRVEEDIDRGKRASVGGL